MGAKDHREKAAQQAPARCAVITVSDTRTLETDESGRAALEILRKHGHQVQEHRVVPNDRRALATAVREVLAGETDFLLTIGGTGPSKKDLTIETVRELIVRELPGFGELFRALSLKSVGTAAILSRALLGVTDGGKVVASTPGSPAAVRLALEEILVPEIGHLIWELRRYG